MKRLSSSGSVWFVVVLMHNMHTKLGDVAFILVAPADNLQEVLGNIVKKEGISKERKLGYFNAFVRFCHRYGTKINCTYSHEEVLCW